MSRTSRRWLDAPVDADALPAEPGSYVVELELAADAALDVGRLGRIELPAGRVRYYGSARGPGGLRARLRRHLAGAARPHWHVDALTARFPVVRVALARATEHQLVAADLATERWRPIAPGFGASDCRGCPAHLLAEDVRAAS